MVRITHLFTRKHPETYPPISFNKPLENKKHKFPPNVIKSTKYSILTFLPKFLFTQFTMVTNIYFLAIMIICCIPSISTVTPITSIVPLIVVLAVSALKEIYEDVRRYLADRKFNNEKYDVFCEEKSDGNERNFSEGKEDEIRRNGFSGNDKSLIDENLGCQLYEQIESSRIISGMIITLKKNQIVPADCIPLRSSNDDGNVFVETAALDGETSLKTILVPNHFLGNEQQKLLEIEGYLECEYPHPKFDRFYGSIVFENQSNETQRISINEKNLLLQGSVIRNTEEVSVIVVYCGKHTKLSLNQNPPKLKKSSLKRTFNIFVLVMIVIQCIISLVGALFAGSRFSVVNDPANGYWYLPKENYSPAYYGFKKFFGYFTLISYIIPISCQVSLDLAQFFQALFMEADCDMKIKEFIGRKHFTCQNAIIFEMN